MLGWKNAGDCGKTVSENSILAYKWSFFPSFLSYCEDFKQVLRRFDSFVEGKIRNLGSKEQTRIRIEIKDAYPEITASLERGVEFSGNVGLDNVLEKCKKCFCINVLPKDKVSTCFSDVGVTKLGNTLSK
ncbi:hypothetical protein [Wolbachia endosymbiont of Cantharis cryptica]|uniref:hypothetical protein n=1 Tax=Wolbachia endosymbiont of Cantharis cryptica TaxID=3066132 RepID=UPI00376EC02E